MTQQQQQQRQPQPQPQVVPALPPWAGQQVIQNNSVARQLSNLCMELRMAQVSRHVRTFGGESHKKFTDWLKDMDKLDICHMQCAGDGDRTRSLAISILTGPAADFLLRTFKRTPAATWNQMKDALKQRYSDLSDVLYARHSM